MENYLKEYIDAYLIKTQNSQRAAEVWRQFHLYTRLLQEWNERINLTAITEDRRNSDKTLFGFSLCDRSKGLAVRINRYTYSFL